MFGSIPQIEGLNFSDVDVAVELHFALFNGSSGFVLKPSGMRFERHQVFSAGESTEKMSACGASSSSMIIGGRRSSLSTDGPRHYDDDYWPPPRDLLHSISLDIVSLHNLPKV